MEEPDGIESFLKGVFNNHVGVGLVTSTTSDPALPQPAPPPPPSRRPPSEGSAAAAAPSSASPPFQSREGQVMTGAKSRRLAGEFGFSQGAIVQRYANAEADFEQILKQKIRDVGGELREMGLSESAYIHDHGSIKEATDAFVNAKTALISDKFRQMPSLDIPKDRARRIQAQSQTRRYLLDHMPSLRLARDIAGCLGVDLETSLLSENVENTVVARIMGFYEDLGPHFKDLNVEDMQKLVEGVSKKYLSTYLAAEKEDLFRSGESLLAPRVVSHRDHAWQFVKGELRSDNLPGRKIRFLYENDVLRSAFSNLIASYMGVGDELNGRRPSTHYQHNTVKIGANLAESRMRNALKKEGYKGGGNK